MHMQFYSPMRRASTSEIELDVHVELLKDYDRAYFNKEVITLPTGKYCIAGYFHHNRNNQATIYLRKLNVQLTFNPKG